MEPRTALHKKVVALSGQLPSITAANTAWAKNKCLPKYVVRYRKTLYCLECGHTWKDSFYMGTKLLGCTCPQCGTDLKESDAYRPYFQKHEYLAAVTTREDMQVVRIYFLSKTYHKHKVANYHLQEVMQHWIDVSGKVTTMAKKTMGLSMYYDQWCHDSKLEVRGYMSNANAKFNLAPQVITPGRKVLPVFKRNGYKGQFYGMGPHHFFTLLASNNRAETLLKCKQIPLFQYLDQHPVKFDKFWRSIRICIRNNYLVTDTSLWFDYVEMLEEFGKDLLSPKYVCPEDLHHAHNRLLAKKKKIAAQVKREKQLAKMEAEQVKYLKLRHRFFGLVFSQKNIKVKPLQSVSEFFDEGEQLEHCVYHSEYYKKKNSLVLSASVDNVPMETIEISLQPLKIIQARGLLNKPTSHHRKIINLVEANLSAIANCI